jgi:hypothetical protein
MLHPQRDDLALAILNEYKIHIKGNIILSASLILLPHLIQGEICIPGATLSSHNSAY